MSFPVNMFSVILLDVRRRLLLIFFFPLVTEDNEEPVIMGCPGNITRWVGVGVTSVVITWTKPNATDNFEVVSFNSSHEPGSMFLVGVTRVNYTATDLVNKQDTCEFYVTIIGKYFHHCHHYHHLQRHYQRHYCRHRHYHQHRLSTIAMINIITIIIIILTGILTLNKITIIIIIIIIPMAVII